MLDVSFDALKQREQHRRMQRMVALTALALAVMAVTVVLSIFALVSRQHAMTARHKAVVAERAAVVARDDAKRRQAQAEDILGFMLGDLRKKLATVGRLDLMRAVDDKATGYFATLQPRDLTDTILEQQARLLTDIGQVRLDEGNLIAAKAAFREALDRTSTLYERAPGNGNRLFDRAQAEYWVGFVAMQEGDNGTAEAMFRKYYASAVKLAAMNPHDFDWQKEVAYGLQAVSVMDKKLGRTAEAERGMQQQLAMYHVWLKQRPEDPQLRFEAANVVSWLGSLAFEQGHLDIAEKHFAEQVRDLQQNMAAEPANADWKSNSVDALTLLADVQEQRGESGPARANLAKATALAATLYAQDPSNNEWRAALARTRLTQSELDAAHRPRQATDEARRAESLMLAARAKDPKSSPVLESLVRAHEQLAQLALSHGDPGTAAQQIKGALALAVPAWKAKPTEALRLHLAQAWLLQGELAQRERRPADARDAWNQARSVLLDGAKTEVPFYRLDLLVRVLQRLGRSAEAARCLKRLQTAGYVPLQRWPDAAKSFADAPRTRLTSGSNLRR